MLKRSIWYISFKVHKYFKSAGGSVLEAIAILNECHKCLLGCSLYSNYMTSSIILYVSLGFTNSALQYSFVSPNEAPFYLWGSSTSGLTKLSVTRPFGRAKTRWSQVGKLNDTCPSIYLSFLKSYIILDCINEHQ